MTALFQALETFPAVAHTVKPDDRTPEYSKAFRKANQVRASLFDDNLLTKIQAFISLTQTEIPSEFQALSDAEVGQFISVLSDHVYRLRDTLDGDLSLPTERSHILYHSFSLIYVLLTGLVKSGFSEKTLDAAMAEFHAFKLLQAERRDFTCTHPDLTPFVQPATKD